jgi:phenylalanine-4-hydroxylase
MNPTKQNNKPIMKQTKAMSKRVCVCEETNSPEVQHKLSREKEMCVEKQTLHRYNNTERCVWRNKLCRGTQKISPERYLCEELSLDRYTLSLQKFGFVENSCVCCEVVVRKYLLT